MRAVELAGWLTLVLALDLASSPCRCNGDPVAAAAASASTRLILRYQDVGISTADARASIAGMAVAAAAALGGDASAASAAGGSAVSSMRRVGGARGASRQQLMRGTFVVQAASADAAAALLAAAKSDPGIAWAEPDTVRRTFFMPSECAGGSPRCRDTPDSRYWHVLAAELDRAWAARGDGGLGGTRVQGGIIDTGVMLSHTELAGVMDVAKSCDCSGPAMPCSGSGADDNGHGTHCAGIMAARHNNGPGTPIGVLSRASLVACKFLDRWGSGYTSDAVECFLDLLAKGNVGVLSNSWGGSDSSDALRDAIKAACDKDVLVVVAAGNEGLDVRDASTPTYPAAYAGQPGMECLLAVAATDASGRLADYSNFGAAVEIAAPGSSVFSTFYSGVSNAATAVLSGTSMATPLVAALGLALRNNMQSLTALQVKQALVRSGSITPPGPNIAGKLVNASALISAVSETSTGRVACTPGGCPSTTPVCVPSEGCVACATAADCALPAGMDRACNAAVCTFPPGSCSTSPRPSRTACVVDATGAPGMCNGAGVCVDCLHASDCTVPFCQLATCDYGTCRLAPAPASTDCWTPGGQRGSCDGAGTCKVGCLVDGDCTLPGGVDRTCAKPVCERATGQCKVAAAAASPVASCTIATSGTPGFCGLGGVCVACATDAHCSLPAGADNCSAPVCDVAAGRCRIAPAPASTACELPGGDGEGAAAAPGYCDGRGTCKACLMDEHCARADLHAGCVASVCNRTSGQCAAPRPLPAASACTLPGSNSTGVCNGQGRCFECLHATQCQLPAGLSRACTAAPVCNASSNTCMFPAQPANTTCRLNALVAGKCNGAGVCSECLAAADCSRKAPAGWASSCTLRSCVAGACSFARAPVGQACSSAGWPGKCDAVSQCRSCSANRGGSCRRDINCCVGSCVLNGTSGTCQAS